MDQVKNIRIPLHLSQNGGMLREQRHLTRVIFQNFPSLTSTILSVWMHKYTGGKIHRCLPQELSNSGPPQVIIMQPGRPPSLGHTLSSRFDTSHSLQIRLSPAALGSNALMIQAASAGLKTRARSGTSSPGWTPTCLHPHWDYSPAIWRAESANPHWSEPKR